METVRVNNIDIPVEELEKLGWVKPNTISNKRWKPSIFEQYWSVGLDGAVWGAAWGDDSVDNWLHILGNIYKTEEEAKSVLDRSLATQRVLDRLRELEPAGWVADFTNINQKKYLAWYDISGDNLGIDYSEATQKNIVEFYSTKEAWQKIIRESPRDIKLMLGV